MQEQLQMQCSISTTAGSDCASVIPAYIIERAFLVQWQKFCTAATLSSKLGLGA
jgi:hypothetical protein